MNYAKLKVALLLAFLIGIAALGIFGMALSATTNSDTGNQGLGVKATPGTGSREVTLSPCGTVTFNEVPKRIITMDANYNDMLEAFGVGSGVVATGSEYNFYDGFYEQIPGMKVGLPKDKVVYMFGDNSGNVYDKEFFYEMNADIHHIDPRRLAMTKGWSKADVDEISRNVAPFLANRFSRENIYRGEGDYTFYDLWELSAKISEVYLAQSKIEKLKALADDMTARIQAKLPPPDQRPTVALLFYGNGRFTPYSLKHGGFGQAQYRALKLRDAFAAKHITTYGEARVAATAMDLEGLAAVNPDIIIMPFAIYTLQYHEGHTAASFKQLQALKDNPIAQKVHAFQTGSIYVGGTPLQGPIFYIFQLEMAAKQVFPEVFGKYRDDQNYPPEERLFSRKALAQILSPRATAQ